MRSGLLAANGLDAGAEERRADAFPRNPVLFLLAVVGIAAGSFMGFVSLAPNRLLSGHPVPLWHAAGPPQTAVISVLAALLLAAAIVRPSATLHRLVAVIAGALILLLCFAAGRAASGFAASGSASRTSLGGGFWVMLFCAALAIVDALQRQRAGVAQRLLVAFALAGLLAALAWRHVFAMLSIAREYANRSDVFGDELLRHVGLVAATLGAACAIGIPLGVAAARRPRFRDPLFAALSIVQTVPSIALFGLLIAPLSALSAALPALAAAGIHGIGATPALIALILYALLPIVRNTAVGINGVERGVIETAEGMGFTRRQIFWRIELPLSLPVLLAGIRIVTVQTIGLTVVAALIGAGGLGSFVFQGLGQYALDLVLLGAIPTILLALAADFGLQIVTAVVRQGMAP